MPRAAPAWLFTATLLACAPGAASGCAGEQAPYDLESRALPLPRKPDPFVYGEVTERAAPVPERFTAKLPVLRANTEWPELAPPRSHVVGALCYGGEHVRSVFLQSLEEAARDATELAALEPYWRLFAACQEVDEGRCVWAAGVATSGRPLLVRQAVSYGIVGCAPEHEAFFQTAEAPIDAVLIHVEATARYSRKRDLPPPPARARRAWPRLVAAAREREEGDEKELARVLHGLWLGGDASVRDFVLERYRELPDGKPKAAYGRAACAWRGGAEAERACATHCEMSQAPECNPAPRLHNWIWPTDLSVFFCGGHELTGMDLYSDDGKALLTDRLADCLTKHLEPSRDTPSRTLFSRRFTLLGVVDFSRARGFVSRHARFIEETLPTQGRPSDEMAARVREQVELLDAYDSREDAAASLRKLGLHVSANDAMRGLTIEDLLEEGGLAITIAPYEHRESGCAGPMLTQRYEPLAHDLWARRITRPISGALEGVVFEQHNGPRDTLSAYFDGRVLQTGIATRSTHGAEHYDVGAIVGLVNAVLRARDARERLAVSTAGRYETVVVAADGDAIRRAYEADLLDVVELTAHERRH